MIRNDVWMYKDNVFYKGRGSGEQTFGTLRRKKSSRRADVRNVKGRKELPGSGRAARWKGRALGEQTFGTSRGRRSGSVHAACKKKERGTYNICDFGYGSERCREFGGINEVIGGRMETVMFRQVSAHAKFIRGAIELWLDVYDNWGRLEGPFHNVFHFFLGEGTMHSPGGNFFLQVDQDLFVVF
jgi:hypothetical protein